MHGDFSRGCGRSKLRQQWIEAKANSEMGSFPNKVQGHRVYLQGLTLSYGETRQTRWDMFCFLFHIVSTAEIETLLDYVLARDWIFEK